MPHPIILHHFDRSPFSEKIRVVLGHKGLSWRSVRIPQIMPKPDLMPLTGGYRRTPVMQIGADVFCDTADHHPRNRTPLSLADPVSAGRGRRSPGRLSSWTDRAFFQNAVNLVFGTLGPKVPQAFIEDRSQMRGAKFDLDRMRAAIPQMRDQLRAHLGWIEAQLGDGRKWLLGEFSLADVSAYMNVWYVRSNLAAEEDRAIAGVDTIFAGLKPGRGMGEPRCERSDTGAAKKCPPTKPSPSRRRRARKRVAENDPDDPNGRKVGDKVRVAPDDYGKVEVGGEIVSLSAQHIAIRRVDERVGEIVVHFPRAGFRRPARAEGFIASCRERSGAARGRVMRPSALDPLFAPAERPAGIGPKNAKLFDRLLDKPQGARVLDVLFHLPQATVDRRARPKIRDAVPGTIVTIEAKVTEHHGPPNARSRAPFKVLVEDDTGDVELVFFLANHEWVRSRLPVGATRWISGKLELWDGRRQMVHPDRVMTAEELDRLPSVEPVYGLTDGLYQRTRRPRRGGRAQAPAAAAGMDQREDAERSEIAELRASARRDAPPRDARGYRPGRSGGDAARL